MSDTSAFKQYSFKWLFRSDEVVPITGLEAVAELRTGSVRRAENGHGQHRLRYRSITGRRLTVVASSTLTHAIYSEARSVTDYIAPSGDEWLHEGASALGSRIPWEKEFANYEATGITPGVAIEASVRADAPFEKPHEAAGFFPLV